MRDDETKAAPAGAEGRRWRANHTIVIAPSRMLAMVILVVLLGAGVAVGFYLAAHLKPLLGLYGTRHARTLLAIRLAPALLMGIAYLKLVWPRFMMRHTLSECFVTCERSFPMPRVDSCDMTNVKDARLYPLGAVANLVLYTKDVTTPTITIYAIPIARAREAFDFVREHAVTNLTEYRAKVDHERRVTREGG